MNLHHNSKAKKLVFNIFVNLYIKKKTEISTLHKYSSLFGYNATSFAHLHLAIIYHSSPHLFTSQALSGWMRADTHFQVSPEMFDWVQIQAVDGPLKDIHRAVYKPLLLVLRVIVLLEGEPFAQSEVLNALD